MNTHTFTNISNHSLLLVKGPDARKFLQGQVTCDIERLNATINSSTNSVKPSCLGAHCTHKGRIVFTFRAALLEEDTVALKIPSNMMDIATNALKKYIVFSKAELLNHSDDKHIIGLNVSPSTLESLGFTTLEQNNTAATQENGTCIRLEEERFELWLDNRQYKALLEQLSEQKESIKEKALPLWDTIDAKQGRSNITPETSDKYTPHAINLQNIDDGVSFDKGCYTGQEVVARMHYLGNLKKQLFSFRIINKELPALPTRNAPLYTAEKESSIGDIIDIVQNENEVTILASTVITHAEADQVYLDKENHIKLQRI